MSKIPDKIQKKIDEMYPGGWHNPKCRPCEQGYELAMSELEAKDYQINELIRTTGNAQDTLMKEIERLKKEIEFLKSQNDNLSEDLKNAYPF